jgi:hypothetical protein
MLALPMVSTIYRRCFLKAEMLFLEYYFSS